MLKYKKITNYSLIMMTTNFLNFDDIFVNFRFVDKMKYPLFYSYATKILIPPSNLTTLTRNPSPAKVNFMQKINVLGQGQHAEVDAQMQLNESSPS